MRPERTKAERSLDEINRQIRELASNGSFKKGRDRRMRDLVMRRDSARRNLARLRGRL